MQGHQHLQAGACCLPQKRLTSVNANKPRRLLGKLALALPQHDLGKPKPLLLLGAPRTETGNPPGTCKSTFHAWGVSKGHTGCQGLPWSLWPSIMCFDNCRQAYSFRDSTQNTSQTKMLINTSTYNEDSTTDLCCMQGSLTGRQRDPSWLHTAISQLTMPLPTLWPGNRTTTYPSLRMQPMWVC